MSIQHKLRYAACIATLACSCSAFGQESRISPNLITDRAEGRTSYQQQGKYDPRYDLKTDTIMVYGVSDSDIEGLKEWKERSGSHIAVMTGIAWGEYVDYLYGRWDGIDHWDDAQTKADGERQQHGVDVPYMSPSVSFTNYLEERLRKVVDAGVDEIYLEEPEFWAFTGFGPSFQREWKIYYNEEFIRPDSSVDAQYRASKLKQHLYRRALDRCAAGLKEYSLRTYNRPLKVYVATHSLLSYAQISMVSPESSLLDLAGIDGLIGQIWTGTSRFGNFYDGAFAERTFEIGLLEYGSMQEMGRGTGKRIYYLNDPVEDNPRYSWDDYRTNYLCTLVASLMRSGTSYYEVAPWPNRIFLGRFPQGSRHAKPIPADYASTLNLVFNQLRDMDQDEVEWLDANAINTGSENIGATEKIGALLADSAMFQRANPTTRECAIDSKDDPTMPAPDEIAVLGDALGLTMPLIKRGVPVEMPILDNAMRFTGYLDDYKVLLLSYDYQKPSTPGLHAVLANWVARGGALILVDSGKDGYNKARDWWNQSEPSFNTPAEHLLVSLGLKPDQESGKYAYGEGWVYYERKRPTYYTRSAEKADEIRALVADAAKETGLKYIERNYFLKRRGPYLLASTLTESCSDAPLTLKGAYVNLFDASLSILDGAEVKPGERAWLLDLNRVTASAPVVLASSCRIESLENVEGAVKLATTSIADIDAVTLMKLDAQPTSVKIDGEDPIEIRWDEASKTLYFKFHTDGEAEIVLNF